MSQQDFLWYSAEECVDGALCSYDKEIVYIDHDVDLTSFWPVNIAFCCASHKPKCDCEYVCYVVLPLFW